jgi:hypothetical protein
VGDDDSQSAEAGGSRRDAENNHDRPGRLRRVFGAFSFLRPANPPEALALVVICSTLIAGGAAAFKGLASVFAGDPWSTRADRVCLRAGNAYLSVDGKPREQMRERVQITRDALADLAEISDAVPIGSTLSYQSMLSDKRYVLRLMEEALELPPSGSKTAAVEGRIDNYLEVIYGPHAEQLGLSVCGQGSGKQ